MPNGNPFYVQPASLQGLGQLGSAYFEKQNKLKQQEEIKGVLGRGNINEMSSYIAANPEFAANLESAYGFKNEATKKNATETAFSILSGNNSDEAIMNRAQLIRDQGGDPSGTLSMLDMAPEQREQVAKMTLAQFGSPAQFSGLELFGKREASKFQERQQEFKEEMGRADLELRRQEARRAGGGSPTKVGAQEILEDGTTIQSTPEGMVVYNPQGKLVKGQAAADAIKIGRAEKVSNLRKAAGEKKLATLEAQNELEGEVAAGVISQKEAANASVKAFDKIEGINEKIALYDEGIALIDAGAGSGRIEKMFPSFKTASIKLDNLANRLGLDVVGNTTFGALSAGELAMAMSTALPTGLDGPELREWMVEKKEVQEKLADYLESSAIYLGTPGNTKVGWLKKKKLERSQGRQDVQTEQAPQPAIDFLSANPQAAEQFKAKYGYIPEGL